MSTARLEVGRALAYLLRPRPVSSLSEFPGYLCNVLDREDQYSSYLAFNGQRKHSFCFRLTATLLKKMQASFHYNEMTDSKS